MNVSEFVLSSLPSDDRMTQLASEGSCDTASLTEQSGASKQAQISLEAAGTGVRLRRARATTSEQRRTEDEVEIWSLKHVFAWPGPTCRPLLRQTEPHQLVQGSPPMLPILGYSPTHIIFVRRQIRIMSCHSNLFSVARVASSTSVPCFRH